MATSKNSNDKLILELQKQVRIKKAAVAQAARFAPVTNCSLVWHDKRYNVNVLQKDELIMLIVELNVFRKSAVELGYVNEYKIAGFTANEWLTDLSAKLAHITIKEEEANLKAMESRLEALLSNDKKIERELADIASSLK